MSNKSISELPFVGNTGYTVNDVIPIVNYDPSGTTKQTLLTDLKSYVNSDIITTIVNVSSTQILAMGTTPIELLPAPGVGKYYDNVKVILEYTHGTANYNLSSDLINVRSEENYKYIALCGIDSLQTVNKVTDLILGGSDIDSGLGFVFGGTRVPNNRIVLDTYNNTNPTDGDGTLRAIITYTIRTFGV